MKVVEYVEKHLAFPFQVIQEKTITFVEGRYMLDKLLDEVEKDPFMPLKRRKMVVRSANGVFETRLGSLHKRRR